MVGAVTDEPYPRPHTLPLQGYSLGYQAPQMSLHQLLKISWLPWGCRRLRFTRVCPVLQVPSSPLGSGQPLPAEPFGEPPASPKSRLSSTSLAAELSLWQSP